MEGNEKEKIDGIVENEPQSKISEEVKPPKGDKKETVILISIWSVVAVLVVVCLFLLFRCDHVYGEWKVVSPATCVSDGLAERYCLNDCGKSETKAIGNGAHSYSSPKVVEKATCTSEGRSESTCTICKDVKTTAIAKETHTYGQWFVSVESTCTADGEKKSVCVYCGDERVQSIEKTNHIFGGWNIVKEATCVNEGLKERKCTGCDLKESTSINLVDHVYGDWRVTKTPTCQENGEQISTCNVCGDKKTASVNKVDHSYGAWNVVENPGCVTNGLEKSYCTMCNKERSRSIAATGHTDGEWIVDNDATCTESGSKYQVCSSCDEILKTEVISAKGHANAEWIVDKYPTCSEAGQKHMSCVRCQEIVYSKISQVDHNYKGTICVDCSYTRRIGNFVWKESFDETYYGYRLITIIVGEEYQLKYSADISDGLFYNLDNFVFYEPTYVVETPSIISIDENGKIKGLKTGLIGIKCIYPLVSGSQKEEDRRLYIRVISEYTETEYNDTMSMANEIKLGKTIKFNLSGTSDVDVFKFTAPSNYVKVICTYHGDYEGAASGQGRLIYVQILNSNGTLMNSGTNPHDSAGNVYERTSYIDTSTGYILFKFNEGYSGLFPSGYFTVEVVPL